MKRVLFAVLAATFISGSEIGLLASPQSVEGVVSDTMWGGRQHMLPGKTAAQCIKECLGGKTHYALVVGDRVYAVSGPVSELEKYAGEKVRVTGELVKDTIVVHSLSDVSNR
jgi:hypothetical protein